MRRWRIGLAIAAIVLVAGGALWLARGTIATAMMERLYAKAMAPDPFDDLPDGLHVGLCGSGSPMPDPMRTGPCTAVLAGKQLFVIDAGAGSTKNLSLMDMPPAEVQAIFLTHLHSDHIDGLGELMLQRWAGGGRSSPLPVHGPVGVDKVVQGFMQAYEIDRGFRIAHHGEAVVRPTGFGGTAAAFDFPADGANLLLVSTPDLKVVAFPVRHAPAEPSVGYRFDYKGRSVVVSGDTAPSERLESVAKGADLLVHEALSPKLVAMQTRAAKANGRANLAAITRDILSYHTAPEDAARIAQRAGVRYLLFTHIIPPLPVEALEGPFLGDSRKIFRGPIRVGRDGDVISLPAGSTDTKYGNRLMRFR
ncbi:MBL fold metallo-hydrolase [Caulobacter mirabilis]|uniref:MBL fold metallo-hydrolase n=1 Tax=Caulobacter mirabilis TaxID=69666 RepID=A0A2D2AWK9_9CAUL|nr:MBL fold metallo-hydrolase [Caulobacter mirabilis]ATQ42400.1 MBL fold metallo-hydrolase [Caulobacter mirabilis]